MLKKAPNHSLPWRGLCEQVIPIYRRTHPTSSLSPQQLQDTCLASVPDAYLSHHSAMVTMK